MRVLHIVAGMNPRTGGVAQAIKGMVEGLSKLDVYNEVVCLDDPDETFIKHYNFKVIALGPAKTAWRFSPVLLKWLHTHLVNYDVMIVHGLWQYHSYAVIKALSRLRKSRPALFVMPHGMLDPYFQKTPGRRFKAWRNELFWLLVERKLVNRATCLLFTCENERKLATQSFRHYSPKSTVVVGLGLAEPPVVSPQKVAAFKEKCGGNDPGEYILFISRIDIKKGVDLLVRAYLKFCKSGKNIPKLVIAGPGLETVFGKKVMELAGDSGHIIFTGMLLGDEKWGAFHQCEAMILPSHQENFGFVVVEALACGKPVLISDQVNIWEEVTAGHAGVVQPDTEGGALSLLEKWHTMKETEKKAMAANARKLFDSNYSLTGASGNLKAALAVRVNAS